MPTELLAVATGFATAIALIAAIGAQNAFVLRQGLRGEHVVAVVTICALTDVLLIFAGIAGFGALIATHPGVITVAEYGGAAFLTVYAVVAARRALRPGTLTPAESAPARLTGVLATCLALTLLNPHVYLDTVILLGALANDHGAQRWLFGGGAAAASTVWFSGLGFGATKLRGLFATPTTWRVLDVVIAVTMLTLAGLLILH
ncbi:LysE/ArgO family amino acid transporter [Mycobacterium sp. SMC-4]|uniref:LysE/ArgO family amino acid transporter n=1 Tax=Mycobacterium sp. SMC-4 TaxID=2857059 RepID=UPI003D023C6D